MFAVRRQGRQLAPRPRPGRSGPDPHRGGAVRGRPAAAGRPRPAAVDLGSSECRGRPDRAVRPVLVASSGRTAQGAADDDVVDGRRGHPGPLVDWWVDRTQRQTSGDDGAGAAAGGRGPDPGRDRRPSGPTWRALTAGTPMEELAEHNRQLLATLEEVQAHRDELVRLNAELEETNRGVMALYAELSEELEATNRGVVALYAELDQRSEQLRAASEAKTRFLANVSHELRSPVTVDRRTDPAAARPAVRPAHRRAGRAARADRRLGAQPARPRQRAARPGQGRVRAGSSRRWSGRRPQGRSSTPCAARCGRAPRPTRPTLVVAEPSACRRSSPIRSCSPRCCAT